MPKLSADFYFTVLVCLNIEKIFVFYKIFVQMSAKQTVIYGKFLTEKKNARRQKTAGGSNGIFQQRNNSTMKTATQLKIDT